MGLKQNDAGRVYIDLLDKEIGICSAGFPGDSVGSRLAAMLSVEEAKSLAKSLRLILSDKIEVESVVIPRVSRFPGSANAIYLPYNPDEYPKAAVLLKPVISIRATHLKDVSWPFPWGSEGRSFPIVVASTDMNTGEKIPALLLDEQEARRIISEIDALVEPNSPQSVPWQGKSQIDSWKRVDFNRLVFFKQIQETNIYSGGYPLNGIGILVFFLSMNIQTLS